MNWFRDRFNNFRLTGSQDNNRLEQEIERRAYELWEEAGRPEETFDYYYKKAQLEQEIKPTAYLLWKEAGKPKGQFQYYLKQAEIEIEIRLMTYLMWKKDGKTEDKYEYYEDYYWEQAKQKIKFKRLPIIYKPFYFVVGKPYYVLEKKILEPGLAWTDKQAFFDIIGRLGNLAIVIGVISFIFTEDYRRNAEVFSAWQTITSANDIPGSGGRIEALEFLNSRPLRLPFIARFPFITFTTEKHWYWDGKECKNTRRLGYRFPQQSLSGLSAPQAYLTGIKLCGANLREANLKNAHLDDAKLQNADLFGAKLQNSYLDNAKLQDAFLSQANLQNSYLRRAKLQNAYLGDAKLQDANLFGACLQDANLFGANLQEAYLFTAKLQNANLREANLQNANLVDANLQGADLRDAHLSGAIYTDSKSSFIWQQKSPAFLMRECSKGSCITIFPDNFYPKKAGMILIRTQEDYDKWKESRQK